MTFKYRYRKQIVLSISILVVILSIIIGIYYTGEKQEKKSTKTMLTEKKVIVKKKEKEQEKEESLQEIMVDVKGEVMNSGIYTLKKGSRVIDAINLAGGVTKLGDTSVLNLSKKLEDEMVIIVYSYYEVRNFEKTKEKEETVRKNCTTGSDGVTNDACIDSSYNIQDENKKVSLNQATLEELMTLSGVGESKAKSIIEYRNKNGGFQSIEEVKKVNGIGDSLFDKIKENITL
ncbi:MAG: DNA-binding protein [Bacilli bacterium]|nr:DNA-binding protein [Bacilli bacterium]